MQGSQETVVPLRVREASQTFARLSRRLAVRAGGKSVIARRIGREREVVVLATSGEAHTQEKHILQDLVNSVRDSDKIHPNDIEAMREAIKIMKPDS